MELYLTSKFCLMLPGDSQTSRRLPEAVMAGCVPVFLGPPFHSMPLANQARACAADHHATPRRRKKRHSGLHFRLLSV